MILKVRKHVINVFIKGSPRTLFVSAVPAVWFYGGRIVHMVSLVSFVGEIFLNKLIPAM